METMIEKELVFLMKKTKELVGIVNELEMRYSRKFSIDGHLLGSIGEVYAKYLYDIELYPQSAKCHDGVTKDGKQVQIKITQIDTVDIQKTEEHPKWLIVLFLNKKDFKLYEVYNGPGEKALKNAKPIQSRYYNRSLRTLYKANAEIKEYERIRTTDGVGIEPWEPGMKN